LIKKARKKKKKEGIERDYNILGHKDRSLSFGMWCHIVVGGYQRFGETYCLHLQGRRVIQAWKKVVLIQGRWTRTEAYGRTNRRWQHYEITVIPRA
jgi:hypothetical protein